MTYNIQANEDGKIIAFGNAVQAIPYKKSDLPADFEEKASLGKYTYDGESVIENPDFQELALTQEEIDTLLDEENSYGYIPMEYYSVSQSDAQYEKDFGSGG